MSSIPRYEYTQVMDLLPKKTKNRVAIEVNKFKQEPMSNRKKIEIALTAILFLGGLYLLLSSKGILPNSVTILTLNQQYWIGVVTAVLMALTALGLLMDYHKVSKEQEEKKFHTAKMFILSELNSILPLQLKKDEIFIRLTPPNEITVYSSNDEPRHYAINKNSDEEIRQTLATFYPNSTVVSKEQLKEALKGTS